MAAPARAVTFDASDTTGGQRFNQAIGHHRADGIAYTSDNGIHLSTSYVGGYTSGDVKEVTGVLYHEATHVWQWNGQGTANGGLVEGIADFMRLKAGLAPGHWRPRGSGNRLIVSTTSGNS
uniref:Uncharacterized protein n=1 Tax=Aegilops tauschii TaxID=37682 RepID=M8CNQ0_AEGTA